jgi:hypothetical protein
MDLVASIGEELRAEGSPVTPGVVSSHSWADDTIYERIYELGGVVTPHAGGSSSFAGKWAKYRTWADDRYLFGIGFGSDANGFSNQGQPRSNNSANPVEYPFEGFGGATIHKQVSGTRAPYDVNRDGVAHYGLYPDWIEDLRKLQGDAIVDDMTLGPEAYLQMWERAVGVPGSSCRTDVADLTPEDFDRLRRGMTVEEVLRALGQPRSRAGTAFTYCLVDDRTGSVTFTPGGEVAGWDDGQVLALALDSATPTSGQVTDEATFAATVTGGSGPAAGETVTFTVGTASATATTGENGVATAAVRLEGPPGDQGVTVAVGGPDGPSATAPFAVTPEDTLLTLFDAVASGSDPAIARAGLAEDGGMLAGRTVSFYVADKVAGRKTTTLLGTAITDANGIASIEVPARYVSSSRRTIHARFEGERDFLPSSATASTYRA